MTWTLPKLPSLAIPGLGFDFSSPKSECVRVCGMMHLISCDLNVFW
jgi:hypothetical protein